MFDLMPWKNRENREAARFRGDLDRLFDRFLDLDLAFTKDLLGEGDWFPSVDIFETEKNITLIADMPGVNAKDLSIDLRDDILTVRGEVMPDTGRRSSELWPGRLDTR